MVALYCIFMYNTHVNCYETSSAYSLLMRANWLETAPAQDCWLVWPHHDCSFHVHVHCTCIVLSSNAPVRHIHHYLNSASWASSVGWSSVFFACCVSLKVISYDGVHGGDEQGEPLDYFAYYDEGIIAKERREKEALEKAGRGKEGEGKEKPLEGGAKVGGKEGTSGKTALKPSAKNGDGDMKVASSATAHQDIGIVNVPHTMYMYIVHACVHVYM